MSFDRLPPEILMKIFSYLPLYDKVSLVNKQFYNAACTLRDPEIWLELNASVFEIEKIERLQSIKKTKRNIKRVSVKLFQTDRVAFKMTIAIMKRFSATINHLSIRGDWQTSDFLKLLLTVPKAEHIDIDLDGPYYEQPVQRKRSIMPTNEDLNLHYLKTLKSIRCSDDIMMVFNRLPAGVLTELKLDHWDLDQVNVLFMRQTNIKKLSLRSIQRYPRNDYESHAIAVDMFNNQKLDYLEWYFDDSNVFHLKNVETVLSKQSNLKTLKLDTAQLRIPLDEGFMNMITNQLAGLETLLICIPETPAAFENLRKLTKLKHLTLRSNVHQGVANFEAFASLDNSRITTLGLQFGLFLSDEVIAKLAKSVPNLKVLHFNNNMLDFKMFNAVMRSFNFIEVLNFKPVYGSNFNGVSSTFIQGDYFNPNLTVLEIANSLPYTIVFLKKLIKNYPNLKKLVFTSSKNVKVSHFKIILSGFKKMESLTLLLGLSRFTIDDLSFLEEYKNRLKFIALRVISYINIEQLKKTFSSIFDVIKISNYTELRMAVDRDTMHYEEFCWSDR